MSEVRWAALATLLFIAGAISQLLGAPAPVWWTFYLACYAIGGWEPALSGLQALKEKTLDVDLLMIVAALLAASIGQIFEGALLIVIFATSGALEAFVTRRTADSVRELLDLAPEQATRLTASGEEEVVDTAELEVGDVVLVRPGERVGADGEVLEGLSEVDQASITGEPLPAVKAVGDEVFAGSLNGTGALRVMVNRAAEDSVVARIVTMVEEASETKARTQLFIEKVEQRYSVCMVVATLALFAVPLAFGAAFEPTLLRAMTFMIVASPCAVVLATMPPLLSTIANAGRHGVLVKSAVALEEFGKTDLVAFDKTGTLTEGTPRVSEVEPLKGAGITKERLVALAAAAERPSEHPLARAVVAAAHEHDVARASQRGVRLDPRPGRDGTGGRHPREGRFPCPPGRPPGRCGCAGEEARALVSELEEAGRTAVAVVADGVPVGVLALADRVRPGAREVVSALRQMTGRNPILLTGDNERAARRLAEEVGITEVRAGLLPDGKVAEIRRLQGEGRRVLLVGDGVNDAPAMAAAQLGVAMGRHGSDLALETADAVVVRDELATLPKVIGLSRRAHRLVKANLAFAATVITVLVVWDVVWVLPLPLGVAGHEGSTMVVGLNGLRLLRRAAWHKADRGLV